MDEVAEHNVVQRVWRGAGAMAIAQVTSQLISLVSVALLMRALSPDEFGLVGMVAPLVLLLRILANCGLMEVSIRDEGLSRQDAGTLFWTHTLLGLLASLATVAGGAFLGAFYHKPELQRTLLAIAAALAGTTFVTALGMQGTALLQRSLRQGLLARMRIVAQLLGAAGAVLAAWLGWGLWSLILGQYLELALLAAATMWASRPLPGWPQWDAAARRLIRGGLLFTLSSVILYLADNTWRLLTGRLIDPRAVGLYGQAWTLMIKPVYLVTTPITGLLLAGVARAGADERARSQIVTEFYRAVAILLMPASAGLMVVAPDVMQVVGGDTWKDASPILVALSGGIFAQAAFILGGYALTAAGQMRGLLAAAVITWLVIAAAHLAGWGIGLRQGEPTLGLAVGWTVALNLLVVPVTWYALQQIGVESRTIFVAWCPPLAASLVMATFVWMFGQWLAHLGSLPRLLLLIPLGGLVYTSLMRKELTGWLALLAR